MKVIKQAATFYNKISFFYPLINLFLSPQKHKLFEEINNYSSGDLLEVGIGTGSHLHLYKKHVITGIDISDKMLKIARNQKNTNIKLLKMNGENLHFQDESFNYVVLSHIITVTPNPEKLLTEAYRILKPDGKIIVLNHFTPKNWLRYFDRAFNPISKFFHFKSLFYTDSLLPLKRLKFIKEIKIGQFDYYKLLIFSKS